MDKEIKRFTKSLRHAIDGVSYAYVHEKNFRYELFFAIFVVALIIIFNVKTWEAVVLILMAMWVLVSELINTVFERVVDILKPRIHPYARLIKDLMAAVVLISSLVAIIVGFIIFYPYFRDLAILIFLY
ncbi:MAG TPA: diacylglycerol kinase [Candidatus Moranbacteria bacterium]|jgi:diacylglycerol kinase|nr:hypothetical protein [Candidatus Moranbacteria bacterium]HOF42256.1 diacylglycerol kinase [Candidatus Moranbacteria bacterium]HPX94344.1 diacylglycerol kinase [Candidatus Moranbacteria bacterium]HQB59473.1 diacylglycerol kinase [Candidatus Moranbacteria bacterium]